MGAIPSTPYGGLPDHVAKDLLRRYADVLRVGRLTVNGREVTWDTHASTANQLQRFCSALSTSLEHLPEVKGLDDAVLCKMPYWLCKALSINYALSEVLHLLSRKVGALCCIEDGKSEPVDYGVELARIQQEKGVKHILAVSLDWRGRDNIVCRDLSTAARSVKGTLSRLETEFPLPPGRDFAPEYTLRLQLRRSFTSRLLSTIACAGPCRPTCSCGALPCHDGLIAEQDQLCLKADSPLRDPGDDDDSMLSGRWGLPVCPSGALNCEQKLRSNGV